MRGAIESRSPKVETPSVELRPIAVSVDDAARVVGISRAAIWRLIASGELQTRKLGGRRLVPVVALEALIHGQPN